MSKKSKSEWTVHEWQGCITVRNEKGQMVARCTLSEQGREYAKLIKRLPEMCNLLNQLNRLGYGKEAIVRLECIQSWAKEIYALASMR